ncbi:MAG: metallophosphoesterase [Ardenticatenia bacterium]|nr:MAG: metallophosphoesterase [Ardenticatenia bacterium]
MKLAILSDIHGNQPALEAVLEDLQREAPDYVVVAGDLVNRGPHNAEVVDMVRAHPEWRVIQGNHDELVADWVLGRASENLYNDPAYTPLNWVAEQLGDERVAYLDQLPFEHVVELPNTAPVLVVHGSPRHNREGLRPSLDDETLATILEGVEAPVVVGAHTHVPMARRVGRWLVLNSGAVGTPFNADPRAQYLLLEWRNETWEPRFRQIEYDRQPVLEAFERTGYLDKGFIVHIFRYEFLTARSHLYYYDFWCRERGLPMNMESWQQYVAEWEARQIAAS